MTADKLPPAPAYLSPSSARLWDDAVERWQWTPADLELLAGGLRHLDIHGKAMDTVEAEGLTLANPKSGHRRPHPALAVATAALRAYRQVLSHLDMELPGEPPVRGSISRRLRRG